MAEHLNIAPARRVLEEAVSVHDTVGHENFGSLSYTHGFMPRHEPLKAFPDSHHAWDEIAAAIPALFRGYTVRNVLKEMPLLSAEADALPDVYLQRASSLFSILAHLYWYCEPQAPDGLPQTMQHPWEQITKRLNRPAPNLSFMDLNSHNWNFIDHTAPNPYRAENLKLCIPLIGNEDERRFQMLPVELLYEFAPLMEVILSAQEAVLRDDPAALEKALVTISDALKHQAYVTLMKVNPNPYSDFYINPVVWGKTAALFASPFQPNNSVPGPSGTAIPSFTTLDIFFGRSAYKTTVGHETDRTRAWFPKYWRDWLTALERVSIPEYVLRKDNRTLKGIYDETRDTYAGETGLLSRHRLKAYGFLDLSFKAGRVKTLGGVGGSYTARVWDRMATELEEARLERYGHWPQTVPMVPVKRVESIREQDNTFVRRIVFDTSETGVRYQAGDRCGILPENSADLVEKTLKALRATGSESIALNAPWRQHVNLRDGHQGVSHLPLRMLLTFGRIRPVDRTTALHLYSLTNHDGLRKILDAWAEDQWELWDMLNMLSETGFNPKRLWKAVLGDYEHICRIVLPEQWRLYSISSTQAETPDELHLTVGGLHYETTETPVSPNAPRKGTGSNFLAQLSDERVSIKVVHPPRFSLPEDVTRPVVLIAGGTGIAPMRSLIAERMRQPETGPTWLFFSTRTHEDFYYQRELEPYVAAGKLHVRVAFTQEDAAAQFNGATGTFELVPAPRQHLNEEMQRYENARALSNFLRSTDEGGLGGVFYVCGRTTFAKHIIETFQAILGDPQAFYRLIGEDRFLLEIFTTYAGPHFGADKTSYHISDVVQHNNDAEGYWIIIKGRVYDMNEFNHIHPGGAKIIQSYSGMDATIAYQKVDHHVNPEVDAMLGMYEIGVINQPDFGQEWGVALSPTGMRTITLRDAYAAWVDFLFMIVEIENAVTNDFRIRGEPFADIETPSKITMTPSKMQQLILAHERLVTSYLDHILGEPLETLWALTVGLTGHTNIDVRWMRQSLTHLKASPQAQTVMTVADEVRTHLKDETGSVEAFNRICAYLEYEDAYMLNNLKSTLREGVRTFETLERETIRQGGGRLVAVLQRVPTVMEEFYRRLAVSLSATV